MMTTMIDAVVFSALLIISFIIMESHDKEDGTFASKLFGALLMATPSYIIVTSIFHLMG